MPTLNTRTWVRKPTSSTTASSTRASTVNDSEKSVAWPTSAMLTSAADVRVRNMLMRVSTSLCAVLRDASRPQCSVASNWARTPSGISGCDGGSSGDGGRA